MAITRAQIARQLLQEGGVSMVDPRMKLSLEENIARNEAARERNQGLRAASLLSQAKRLTGPTTRLYSGTTSPTPFGGSKFFATPDLATAKTYATSGPLRGSPLAGPVTGRILQADVPTAQAQNLLKRGLTGTREVVLDPQAAKTLFETGRGALKGSASLGTRAALGATRALPVVGGAATLADASSRAREGDYVGAALGTAGAVPGLGLPALGTQIVYDVAKNNPIVQEIGTSIGEGIYNLLNPEVEAATPTFEPSTQNLIPGFTAKERPDGRFTYTGPDGQVYGPDTYADIAAGKYPNIYDPNKTGPSRKEIVQRILKEIKPGFESASEANPNMFATGLDVDYLKTLTPEEIKMSLDNAFLQGENFEDPDFTTGRIGGGRPFFRYGPEYMEKFNMSGPALQLSTAGIGYNLRNQLGELEGILGKEAIKPYRTKVDDALIDFYKTQQTGDADLQKRIFGFSRGGSTGFEGSPELGGRGTTETYGFDQSGPAGGDGDSTPPPPPKIMADPDKFIKTPAPGRVESFFNRILTPVRDTGQRLSINYIRNELDRRKNYGDTLAGRLGFKPNEKPFDTNRYTTRTEELEDALTRAIVGEDVTATIQRGSPFGTEPDTRGDNEFIPTLFRQNLVPEPTEPEKTGIEKVLADADEFRFLLPERFKLEEGGIVPRQAYGLGSIVSAVTKPFEKAAKKATRAVKKIAKSDLGKLALAAATIYFAPQLAGRLPAAKNPMSFLGQLQSGNRMAALKTLLPGGVSPTGETSGISKLIQSLGGGTDFQVSGSALKPSGDIDSLGRIFSEGKKLAALPEGLKSVALSGGKEAAKSTLLRDLALIGGPSILAGALAKEDIEDEDLDSVIAASREDKSGLPELLAEFDDFRFVVPEEYRQSAAEGGMMNLGGMEMDLRGGGFVPIGREEKADDVPARLSKNEFVFTADAVRAAGGGSVDKGADLMYKTMKQLENKVA